MDPSRDLGNVVTLRDVFEKLTQIGESVVSMREDVRHMSINADDHERRIRAIERRIWALPSIATIIAVIATALTIIDWVRT